ncbi:hypothetical protein FDH86_gp009 [Arthrobacter phage Tank]|uniref:Uncharacterized protein n=2 Tax=Tankvirus tank TaxID=1982567 RepID=A0A0U4B765_9CAUD|nr:hypothetical protein FDH86_gp009 [Arthrobacter phage Tank]ALY10544.1 hypothetical protein TANK_9 [Arthrobacter phage Tank]ALY10895.1 hypothetical protein WILDE_9 [Arthrobacter phage Wilde]
MSTEVPVFPRDGLLGPIEVESVPKVVSAMALTEETADQVIAWIEGVRGLGAACRNSHNVGGNWVEQGIYVPAMPPLKEGQEHTPYSSGIVPAAFGQWIIRGIEDEFYPCDVEVFAKSYRGRSGS